MWNAKSDFPKKTTRTSRPWSASHSVLFKGNPVELAGPQLKAGDKAPDFSCVGAGLSIQNSGRLRRQGPPLQCRAVAPHPGLQQADAQVQRGAAGTRRQGGGLHRQPRPSLRPVRWCTEAKVENIKNLSDVRDHSFGEHYGVLIKGLPIPLLARAVFVVDPQNTILYAEYVSEVTQEPDYEPALKALKEAAGG